MKSLTEAKSLAAKVVEAKTAIDTYLSPLLKEYIELLKELDARGYDSLDLTADTFVEIEGGTFLFEGEEIYDYGNEHTPSLNLPFEFVADPEAYKANARQRKADLDARIEAKKKSEASQRVERLKAQLAAAEADLVTADAQKDPIKGLANRQRAKELRSTLMKES